MSITTAQIRGARGILNWSQGDLASRTGVSATSIGSIENNQTTPRANTLSSIQRAFESAGIEFIGREGVRSRTGDVRVFTGQHGLVEFYEDVYETIKDLTGEVLVSNVDERVFVKAVGEYSNEFIRKATALKDRIKYKILIREGDDYTPAADYAEYRAMPKELFSSVPFYVYGNKLAMILFGSENTVITISYPAIADAHRVQFEDMWERSREV